MNKNELSGFENESERIPTLEELLPVFEKICRAEYKEIRRLEDEKGIYIMELIVPGEEEGEYTEYAYMRKGHYREGLTSDTEIHATYYLNGMPISGKSVAQLVDNVWRVTL